MNIFLIYMHLKEHTLAIAHLCMNMFMCVFVECLQKEYKSYILNSVLTE